MTVNDIKIRKNKTTYLSKLLFLKNPKIPNGNKTRKNGTKQEKVVPGKDTDMKGF